MNTRKDLEKILSDLKAVLGPKGAETVGKISAHIDEMTGEIEALKYANSLDKETGDILAAQPGFHTTRFTPNERIMLAYIIGRGDKGATREGVYTALYSGRLGGDQPDMKILDVFLWKIRRKFREAGLKCKIDTIPGRGYVYTADNTMKRRDVLFISDQRAAA